MEKEKDETTLATKVGIQLMWVGPLVWLYSHVLGSGTASVKWFWIPGLTCLIAPRFLRPWDYDTVENWKAGKEEEWDRTRRTKEAAFLKIWKERFEEDYRPPDDLARDPETPPWKFLQAKKEAEGKFLKPWRREFEEKWKEKSAERQTLLKKVEEKKTRRVSWSGAVKWIMTALIIYCLLTWAGM